MKVKKADRRDAAIEFVALADTWQFRFDIPIDSSSPEIAREFARTWTELLEAQKLTAIVSSASHPKNIHVQVCSDPEDEYVWSEQTANVVEMLKNLAEGKKPDMQTERVSVDSGDWQGFRLWMTFDRKEAEKFFERRKPKRRFGSQVFNKIYGAGMRHEA